jgi:cell division cycle 20-like protein 1 (cofactor of APC complex)
MLLFKAEDLMDQIAGRLGGKKTKKVYWCSPVRKMLRFKAGDRHSPIAGSNVESPYNLSPIGQDAQGLLSPKMTQRKIARSPFKVQLPLSETKLVLQENFDKRDNL